MYIVDYTIVNNCNFFYDGMDASFPVSTELSIDDLFKYYFQVSPKFKYIGICKILHEYHRTTLKLRQFKTTLKKLKLTRKRNISEEDLMVIISNKLGTSLSNLGYRQMAGFISLKFGINIAKKRRKESSFDIKSRGNKKKKIRSC